MKTKIFTHGLMITAIVIATFFAAALSPADSHAKTNAAPAVANIETVNTDSTGSEAAVTVISDNEMPLAASPFDPVTNRYMMWGIVLVAAAVIGFVIYEDCKDL
ncbi:MAG: hypothetical protein K6E49_02255 [Lachnospiraceae bacterium]|nr:hypothetical protein [Lachnospiraceae bacterium]